MPETESKYFSLFYDEIPSPIYVINKNGKIIYVNRSFSRIWGFALDELNEYNVFSDPELKRNRIQSAIRLVFEKEFPQYVDNYSDSLLKNKDGATPFFKTKIFPFSIDRNLYAIFHHEDQTDIILHEKEIKKAREGKKESERLKNTFLNVLSHELRTPLNIILGYSSIIKESLKDKINPEDKVYLDNLYSGSERLFKSLTQMLEFSQIEAGNFTLNIETVNLNLIVTGCLTGVIPEAEEKELDVKYQLASKPIYVDVDIQSIENVINNLLNNSIKFTKKGFIEVETSVLEERDLAVCRIKDSGIGIASEYLDHLFQPFSQEDLKIGRNYEGNGLGLALTKKYIEKLGGSILVDSIKGVGSTFTFTLPLSQSNLRLKEAAEKKIIPHEKKILMLDDSSDSFGLVTAFLKNMFTIEAVGFQDFNLNLLKNSDYKLILIDVSQNRWNQSLIICSDLKNNDPFKRPIIVVSDEFLDEKINMFLQAGADKFITKPFSKTDLISAIDHLL